MEHKAFGIKAAHNRELNEATVDAVWCATEADELCIVSDRWDNTGGMGDKDVWHNRVWWVTRLT